MLTRWPLTQASQANFSPSINMAEGNEGGAVELIRLLVGWGGGRIARGGGGGASVGLQRDGEERLMRVVIGADRRCGIDVEAGKS